MLHEDREKRRWETFRKFGKWRETTPCVKLTIALFFQSRVRAFNNATIHSCTVLHPRCFSPSSSFYRSPLLSIDVSFFAFAHLRSSQFFQSFPLERCCHPFAPFHPPATYPSTNNKRRLPPSRVLGATDSRHNAQCIFVIKI